MRLLPDPSLTCRDFFVVKPGLTKVGSDATTSDVVVEGVGVLPSHAELISRLGHGIVEIRPHSAIADVYVNGERVPKGDAARLTHGDRVAIARASGLSLIHI